MFARSTTIEAAPSRIDAGIAYIRDEVMPTLEGMSGYIGISVMVDRESGRSITTTAWYDEASMRASDARARALRDRAAEVFGATPRVDIWEIAVVHRMDEAPEGAWVRATWVRADSGDVQAVVEMYRSTLLPALEELPGFRSASLFVDRPTARAVSSVSFDSLESLNRSREQAASLRRSAVQENDLQILEVAEFELVLAHLRAPETV